MLRDSTSSDGTRKWLLDVGAGNAIETVFIPEDDRGTLCISTQAGCAVNCLFCSTGRQGFNRNLTTAEIVGQLWWAEHALRRTAGLAADGERVISNVVLMGMGEPLQNYDAVVPALRLMLDDHAYGLSRRRVTLSTSGMVPQIDRLADDCPVALAVSLHASNDALRDRLVPLNRKYPLRELLAACRRYLRSAPRDFITFEYVMLDGVNDTDAHARRVDRAGARRAVQVQPDPVQSVSGGRARPFAAGADPGFRAAPRRCRHRDHHAQDARRRHRRGLRATGRRSAGPHAGQRAQPGTRGADRFGDPLRRADDTGAIGGGLAGERAGGVHDDDGHHEQR